MTRGTAWPHRKSVTRKQEARGWGERADGQRVSGWDDKKVLKMDRSDSCLKRKKPETFTIPLLYARNYTANQYSSLSSGTFKVFRVRRQVNSKVE